MWSGPNLGGSGEQGATAGSYSQERQKRMITETGGRESGKETCQEKGGITNVVFASTG